MTNTAARVPCQTRRWLRLRAGLLAGLVAWVPPPARPDESPAWQRELDAASLLQAALFATAARPPEDQRQRVERLAVRYRDLAAKYPDQAAVQRAAGDYFWSVGDTPEAVGRWQEAQRLAPQDAEVASSLGSAALQAGQVLAARAQFQLAVDARPQVARHHYDLANVLYVFRHQLVAPPALPDAQAVLRLALAHFRQASELAPNSPTYAQAYAEAFYAVADPDWSQALAAWERVRALDPTHLDFCNGHLARVSLQMGKPEQAEAYLALLREPGSALFKARLQKQADLLKQGRPPADGGR